MYRMNSNEIYSIILNSKKRVNTLTSANEAEFYIDWGAILPDGKYKVKYSICKQISVAHIPWVFRVKSKNVIVPLIADGFTVSNYNNTAMINDPLRGYVFNFTGNNSLTINSATPIISTKCFWIWVSTTLLVDNNFMSSSKCPIWFNSTDTLRASINYGLPSRVNVLASSAQISNAWTHYAISTTGTETKVYVNGVLVTTRPTQWLGDNTHISIGAYESIYAFFNGRIDDIRLYDITLTDTQINDIYNRTI